MRSRFDRKKALLRLIVAMAIGSAGQVQAGFVDDFLDEAQANVNVTQSGILQAGGMNVVTGGGFVFGRGKKSAPASVRERGGRRRKTPRVRKRAGFGNRKVRDQFSFVCGTRP